MSSRCCCNCCRCRGWSARPWWGVMSPSPIYTHPFRGGPPYPIYVSDEVIRYTNESPTYTLESTGIEGQYTLTITTPSADVQDNER